MMWKESYRLGISLIDEQHFELFRMVGDLLDTFNHDINWEHKEKYIDAITFMKNYVVKHFRDEEEYQRSIGYTDYEKHSIEHRGFTNLVLDYEKKFIETNYDLKLVKEFAGLLVSWLIYHVADTDQRIVKNIPITDKTEFTTYTECFTKGVSQVFDSMFNIKINETKQHKRSTDELEGDLFSTIEFVGDFAGKAVFSFPQQVAFQLMKIMTFMEVDQIDEILCSAMAEISNIISGNVATELQSQNYHCDIKPPIVTIGMDDLKCTEGEELHIISADTEIGCLDIVVKTQNN